MKDQIRAPLQEKLPVPILIVVGVGTFLATLAGSAINVALPTLGQELALSVGESRWVVQAYLLTLVALLLPAGRLGDILGHRPVYLVGFGLFGAASWACGVASDLNALIGFRVLQAIAGALVVATAPALLTTTVAPARRGFALGILSTATYLGLTIGPPLGGLIVRALGWRWTLLMNVPISLVMVVLGLVVLPRGERRDRAAFDYPGALLLGAGLTLTLFALNELLRWPLGRLLWVGGLGLCVLAAFLIIELRRSAPLLDLRLFRSRLFTGAVLSALANYMALFMATFLLPFYLQEGLGYEPRQVGLLMGVQPLVMAAVAWSAGWLSDRIGSRGLSTAGMLILAGGILGLSFQGQGASLAGLIAACAVIGLGTGVFISPNSNALMGAAPRRQQGAAGGVMAEARVLGMTLGVAAATVLFSALGGHTGRAWDGAAFEAQQWALRVGAAIAVLGGVVASLRGPLPLPDQEVKDG